MKFVVGYDRALAAACYRRNLRQLIRPEQGPSQIGEAEVDYFAERLAETSVFSYTKRLGSPWMSPEASYALLSRVGKRGISRFEMVRCEHVANNMLIYEGIVGRAATVAPRDYEALQIARRKLELARTLYLQAAEGKFRTEGEREVLRAMSRHVLDWIRYLSWLPGNDFLDMLASGAASERVVLLS